MSKSEFSIQICNWDAARNEARRIRDLVFVQEQGVPRELEWDAEDAQCQHALAYAADGRAIGTGRLLPDGHIGRMAVLPEVRGKGVGARLLNALIELARSRGHRAVRLNAQVQALGFYRRHGFDIEGPQFLEAGIPHVTMRRELNPGQAQSAC